MPGASGASKESGNLGSPSFSLVVFKVGNPQSGSSRSEVNASELEVEMEPLFDKIGDSFDYLLHIKTYQYTHEAVMALNEDTSQMSKELEEMRGTTHTDMWKMDLKKCIQ